ncbi:hypothetical protein FANTH_10101 [Fusarium anthophilum]|uniref:Uncharacterized protein n=1 Tax=Fusarium anthophilum TaxID=48485 RepID=A0A8H4Z335_9HYPO|nr:hypothetical protein FANTH_10101 [Fusarium anthophilum]
MSSHSKPSPEQGLRYDGQVAIITGAGAGMGQAHAILLAQRGARVIVNDLYQETAQETVNTIQSSANTALAVAGNIGDPAVAAKIVETAIEAYGRIDILVNNAGIEIKKNFGDFSLEEFRRVMDVHVLGSWALTSLCWPYMKKQGYGRIVVVSSSSLFGMDSNSAYVTAKGALFGLMKSLYFEGKPLGIQVNALAPIALTNMAKQMIGEDDVAQIEYLSAAFPAWATSPVLAWLVHKDCGLSGEMITSYGRNFGRIFLAETKGASVPKGDWAPEVVRDHMNKALDERNYIRAASTEEVVKTLMAMRATSEEGLKNIEL